MRIQTHRGYWDKKRASHCDYCLQKSKNCIIRKVFEDKHKYWNTGTKRKTHFSLIFQDLGK